jgi:hypothetical protein
MDWIRSGCGVFGRQHHGYSANLGFQQEHRELSGF